MELTAQEKPIGKITIQQAAKIMGVTPRFLHLGLQNDKFPFGTAVKMNKRWSYYINAERFEKWMTGEDLAQRSPQSQGGAGG